MIISVNTTAETGFGRNTLTLYERNIKLMLLCRYPANYFDSNPAWETSTG